MKFNKKTLTGMLSKKRLMKTFALLIVVIALVGMGVFVGLVKTPLNDPLASFQPPKYIPNGYSNVENNTTSNDKIFIFSKAEKQFMVGATKDLNNSELKELKNPFTSKLMSDAHLNSENMKVNGHDIVFQTMQLDFMGVSLNMFHASWKCNQTGLEIIVMGMIDPGDTEEMKKMIESIKCHDKKELIIFGFKILHIGD